MGIMVTIGFVCVLRPIDNLGRFEPSSCVSRETRGSSKKMTIKNGKDNGTQRIEMKGRT